ncbi:MAG TPA: LAGLIDADG family homing endonuclease [Acidimicrobiales bacterium]|nr:LAGLIDADG family homing endonuclease [Acidimicrobiales bacterium]
MAIAPERAEIGIRRHFTTEGVHPYDEVRWERRDARITNFRDGSVAFEQRGVEVPEAWSLNATNILAQKYFRGTLGTPEREWSLKQVADRVVDTITTWGLRDGYFADAEEARIFSDELKHLIVHQKAAFNSPVWFNIGVAGVPQQASACFILSVDDSMDSILNWYTEEGLIFKGGSGAGVNLSRIRSSHELLKGGGTASGPVSFMRGADASAGTIKSGGKTRRAAKMVILDADHPDIEDFIWCKAIEERKARVLRDAGFDMDLDGADSYSMQYQNANNSVRVTDEFMEAVLEGRDWDLVARTDGRVIRTVPARDLFRQIAHAAWECADPGLQYDTTINAWHTAPNTGRINGSNPCFPGDAKVHTDQGLIPFAELFDRVNRGETFAVYTHDATNPDAPAERVELTSPDAFMITGYNDILRLRFDNGMELRCTPGHRIFTVNRGFVEARELTADDEVKLLDLPAPAANADPCVPVSADPDDYRTKGEHDLPLRLPEEWTPELAHYLGWLVGDGSISGSVVSAAYASPEDRDEILPMHAGLVEWVNGGRMPKLSEQPDGTAELRVTRRAFVRYLEALGIKAVRGPNQAVPWAVERAPDHIVASFLQGLFDAGGRAVIAGDDGYVGLDSSSKELVLGVQRLLATFGIASRVDRSASAFEEGHAGDTRTAAVTVARGRSAPYSLLITSGSVLAFARHIGFRSRPKAALLRDLVVDGPRGTDPARRTARVVERADDGVELTYNLSEPRNHSYVVDGVVVRNCSEYLHLDNSACNLASLNLLKFLREDGSFDVDGFKAAVEVVFTGQEILVGNADYPTEAIAETSRRFRELGIGYANLGALLMANGLPYDSDEGRAWAAAITALMTGHAYATSARTAARMGPFAGFHDNAEPMLRVLRKHQAAAAEIDEDRVPTELLSAAQEAWDEAVELASRYGVRNSQASVLAPTGTIGLLMDCDTTGVEPDLSLVKTKKLVGGGTMSIVNQTVPRALRQLGYSPEQVEDIVGYIDEHKTIVGAPHLEAGHLAVFACSMGDNTIHYTGHVRMMGAVQPFISGAISKCVTGGTLVPSEDGLVRIGHLYEGERPDTFREERMLVASLGGPQKTDAFYFGGRRRVRRVVLRSGQSVTGTPNHRLLVAQDGGLAWKRLDELEVGDEVALRFGADVWAALPARIEAAPVPSDGSGGVRVPREMSEDLAFFLGAYAAQGSLCRATGSVRIAHADEGARRAVAEAVRRAFGAVAVSGCPAEGRPFVEVRSEEVVALLQVLGCAVEAPERRIPDAVLRSPRAHVLAFLRGLTLCAEVTAGAAATWSLSLGSPGLLDDLQVVLTNLGIVHGRVGTHDPRPAVACDMVYAAGPHAQELARLVPFVEEDKAVVARRLLDQPPAPSPADVVPGLSGADLHALVPEEHRGAFGFLLGLRTGRVARQSLERVAALEGVVLPAWLRAVLDDGLHFSPVVANEDAGVREVYDLSVPATQAFVGNGIVNHNTVNMPEEATVEEIEQLHIDAWKLGVKAIAIYRDNCKVAQPLSTTRKEGAAIEGGDTAPPGSVAEARNRELAARIAELEAALAAERGRTPESVVVGAVRERLPRRRRSNTFAFRVADCEGYVTVGEYEDGRPGEVFIKVSKQGSTLAGIMDAFSISISLGLQHGVPLATYVRKYSNMRFEPAGITDDADLRIATSLVDYIFRRLALDYLSFEERAELGVLSTAERTQPTLPGVEESATPSVGIVDAAPAAGGSPWQSGPATPCMPPASTSAGTAPLARAEQRDAPYCYSCGDVMQRAGSCYVCVSCGSTSGCS